MPRRLVPFDTTDKKGRKILGLRYIDETTQHDFICFIDLFDGPYKLKTMHTEDKDALSLFFNDQ